MKFRADSTNRVSGPAGRKQKNPTAVVEKLKQPRILDLLLTKNSITK